MLTKEMFEIANELLEIANIYITMSNKTAFTLYEMCEGNLNFMRNTLDLAVDNFVEENEIINFFNDAINGTDIAIDEIGQFIGYKDPRD